MTQRERAKEQRRARILDAAEELIRRTGEVSFPMRTLADRSGVASATPFNLFGKKLDVLLALLERSLDDQFERLAATTALEPIDRLFALGESGVRAYTEDALLFRPLVRGLSELSLDGPLPNLMELAIQLWREALRDAESLSLIEPEIDLDALARLLHHQFRITLLSWSVGEIDADAWSAELEYATVLLMRGAVTDAQRPLLLQRLQKTQHRLEAARHENCIGHSRVSDNQRKARMN